MRIVTARELESWLASGHVLEKDARGPKVVAISDRLYLKIFYTRRHLLLARLQPAAKRFARNAERLRHLGIDTPEIIDFFWLNQRTGISACIYQPIIGETIEQIYRRNPERAMVLLPTLAGFIRTLHQRGIYFRSLHLGNIILLPNKDFGLIDILDLRIKNKPLSKRLIERNFNHLSRYLTRHQLKSFPLQKLRNLYNNHNRS